MDEPAVRESGRAGVSLKGVSDMGIKQDLEPLIRERGVTAIARQSGLDHSQLFNWFAGRRNMSDEKLDRIVDALGVRLVPTKQRRRRR